MSEFITHSVRRINKIAEIVGAKSYLEIGVQYGRTFLNIDIGSKTAVDPRFMFEYKGEVGKGSRYFEMTSDEWFSDSSRDNETYDVIFLDGLHTFEQTFRDFCNSQKVSHSGTIWIIDDVLPTDVYSSLPDMKKAVSMRERFGGVKKGLWHGDIYKAIFAINDYFPAFSFRTCTDHGNPQTVVSRKSRGKVGQGAFKNLEEISRLDFFSIFDHFEYLNTCSESELMEWVSEITR